MLRHMWCDLGNPSDVAKQHFEKWLEIVRKLVYNVWNYPALLIITLDVNVKETKFKQLWKEFTFIFKIRPKTQFCILRHLTGFYRSHHICYGMQDLYDARRKVMLQEFVYTCDPTPVNEVLWCIDLLDCVNKTSIFFHEYHAPCVRYCIDFLWIMCYNNSFTWRKCIFIQTG